MMLVVLPIPRACAMPGANGEGIVGFRQFRAEWSSCHAIVDGIEAIKKCFYDDLHRRMEIFSAKGGQV